MLTFWAIWCLIFTIFTYQRFSWFINKNTGFITKWVTYIHISIYNFTLDNNCFVYNFSDKYLCWGEHLCCCFFQYLERYLPLIPITWSCALWDLERNESHGSNRCLCQFEGDLFCSSTWSHEVRCKACNWKETILTYMHTRKKNMTEHFD